MTGVQRQVPVLRDISARTGLSSASFELLPLSQKPLSDGLAAGERALLSWYASELSPEQWGSWMTAWGRALASYPGTQSILPSPSFKQHDLVFERKRYSLRSHTHRPVKHRKQFTAELQAYQRLRSRRSYPDGITSHCHLCGNIMQTLDHQDSPEVVANNLMVNLETHYVYPNRYPRFPGSALMVPVVHDELFCRHAPGKGLSGRTAGRIVKSEELELLMMVCDTFGLAGCRNHAVDGMSIPHHDHFHLLPRDLAALDYLKAVAGALREGHPQPIARLSPTSPFSMLLVSGGSRRELASEVARICAALEREHVVWTIAYLDGCFSIVPRQVPSFVRAPLTIGFDANLHLYDPETVDISRLMSHLSGHFEWEKFGVDLLEPAVRTRVAT